MGKGDKKTKRGKIILGSYGVRRPRKQNASATVPVIVKELEVVEVAKPKARAKATKKSKEE